MNLVKAITFCKVDPRDGLQNEKTILNTEEKDGMIDATPMPAFSD